MVTLCCQCKRQKKEKDYWLPITEEQYNEIMRIMRPSHGYCAMCAVKAEEEIETFFKNRGENI